MYSKYEQISITNASWFSWQDGRGFLYEWNRDCGKVFGIEINKEAIKDAFKNKELNNLENIDFYKNGVKLKFTGEPTHAIEWVYDENSKMTGYIEDSLYLTSLNDYDENL